MPTIKSARKSGGRKTQRSSTRKPVAQRSTAKTTKTSRSKKTRARVSRAGETTRRPSVAKDQAVPVALKELVAQARALQKKIVKAM